MSENAPPEDETLHQRAIRHAEEAWAAETENFDQGRDDQRFAAGDQWLPQAKSEREQANRPVITVNRIMSFVRQVSGDVRRDTPGIKVRPSKGKASEETADVFNGLIRNIEQESNAKAAYVQAVENACIPGMGNIKVVTEYSTNDGFEQDIRIKRIPDPFAVVWDPAAKEPDKSDARYLLEFTDIPVEVFKKQYPDAAVSNVPSGPNGVNGSGLSWYGADSVRVAQYWYKEPVKKLLLQLADGRVIDQATAEKEAQQKGFIPQVVSQRRVDDIQVKQVIISGSEELTKPADWAGRHIPYAPAIGEEIFIDGRVVRKGMVRDMKDAQRVYNYMRTAAVEAAALQPKMPWLVGLSQIKGELKKIWEKAGSSNLPFLPYDDSGGNNNMPKRSEPALAQNGLDQQAMLAVDELKGVTGIYDASLGAQSNETSGKAIMARQREGDVGTYQFIDNLGTAIRRIGIILVDLIPKIYDTPRMVRVLREDGSQDMVQVNKPFPDPLDETVMRMHDLAVGEYDVTVTVGPSFATRRQEAQEGLREIIQGYPQIMGVAGDLLFKSLDIPFAEEIAKRLEPKGPPPQDPEKMASAMDKAAGAELKRAQTQGQEIKNVTDFAGLQAMMMNLGGQMQAIQGAILQLGRIAQSPSLEAIAGAPPGMPPGGPMPPLGAPPPGMMPPPPMPRPLGPMPAGPLPPPQTDTPPMPQGPELAGLVPLEGGPEQGPDLNALVPMNAEAEEGAKKSKESVDYSKGMGERRCENCVHYLGGACELVAGRIDPTMWCKLFEKREGENLQ